MATFETFRKYEKKKICFWKIMLLTDFEPRRIVKRKTYGIRPLPIQVPTGSKFR